MHEDTEVILKLPSPNKQSEDEVLWHFDKRREHLVKSGYQLALKIKLPNATNSSENNSKQWNALWSLDLPGKIKIFMWRVIKTLLPSYENLWKRKILQEPTCQRCRRSVETKSHALLDCKGEQKRSGFKLLS